MDMWYRYANEVWEYAESSVAFPDGFELKDNHDATRDGWEWYDVSPIPNEDAE